MGCWPAGIPAGFAEVVVRQSFNKEQKMNIFVGGLTREITAEMLKELFEAHGDVESARVVKDIKTGESKGFAFVEMPNFEEGRQAVEALNETEFNGKTLRVEETKGRPAASTRDRRGGSHGGPERRGGPRRGGSRGGSQGRGGRGRSGGGGNRRGRPRGRSDRGGSSGGARY